MSGRTLTVLVSLALALLTVVGAQEADVENGRFIAMGGLQGEVAAGLDTACFRCHGVNGEGDSAGVFPRLAAQPAEYLAKQMRDYAEGRRPNAVMTPIAQALNETQWRDVAHYYAQEIAPYPPRPEVDPDVLQSGGTLVAIGSNEQQIQACVTCHGPAGTGLAPHYPALAGQYASYMEHQLRLWRQGVRRNDSTSMMKSIADSLSEEQIRAVSLYFEAIRPERGQPTVPGTGSAASPGAGDGADAAR